MKFVTDFRTGIKMILDDKSMEEIKAEVVAENHSIMQSTYDVSNEGKIKLLNLENQSLSKRFGYLKTENDMLKEDLRIAKTKRAIEDLKDGGNGQTNQAHIQELKEKINAFEFENTQIRNENQNLRNLLEKMKEVDSQVNLKSMVDGLQKELSELRDVNSQLLTQRDALVQMTEEQKTKHSTEQTNEIQENETGESGQDMKQSTAGTGDRQVEDEMRKQRESTQKLLIEQLSKTNERLMTEIMRLQNQVQAFEDARTSFISDSMNDSYLQNSLASVTLNKK